MVWWFQGETWGQGFLGSATSRDSDSRGAEPSFLAFDRETVKPKRENRRSLLKDSGGKAHFGNEKKKKKITQLSYNLGPFPIRREHFFPAYCLTRLSPGSSVKPSQAPRVFSVG